MYFILTIIFSISLGFGANYYDYQLNSFTRKSDNSINIPDTLRLIGIMSQFQKEIPDEPKTSGNGNFLVEKDSLSHVFYNSDISRCTGFLVDRPPHNKKYFSKQLEAVGNYYNTISNNYLNYTSNIIANTNSISDGYYTVSNNMEYYAKSDSLLAEFFSESLKLAKNDIEDFFIDKSFKPEDVVFIVFHAGLSQDFSYPTLDPTIYDLKSAYIDESMMQNIVPAYIFDFPINEGILLPETQNIIYYNVVEDIFGNPDYGTDDLCDIQIGLTGIFAFLLGYSLGLPEMFDPVNGNPGIGYFGLMDHGSNNGRGVMPAPISPWTRSILNPNWSNIIELSPLEGLDSIYQLFALDVNNTLLKINISDIEYFLIENRNNWVFENVDIDSLRKKNKIDEYTLGYWFDTIINEFPSDNIQIDSETQVITGFDHYDYGLPGSGILIWHINEPNPAIYSTGINTNGIKHVQIKESDGAQDIGTKSYSFFSSDDPTKGTRWDYWFIGNLGYEYANPGLDGMIIFDEKSSPNTLSSQKSSSFLSFEILSEIADVMSVKVEFNKNVNIINISRDEIQYLGNIYNSKDSTAALFYEQNSLIYQFSNFEIIQIDSLDFVEDYYIYNYEEQLNYLNVGQCIHPLCNDEMVPLGYINSSDEATTVPGALSLGDIDGDGLDEIITINDGNIIVKNNNGTMVNGFPVNGDFYGIPLIANILPSVIETKSRRPEIICRENNNIVILSHRGERIEQLSSYDNSQPLVLIPFWGKNKFALVDGARLLLYDLDFDNSYWLDPRGQNSGLPLSIGIHSEESKIHVKKTAYNYPNPITESKTTFRFFVKNQLTKKVSIKIYNAGGYLINNELYNDDLTTNEFNEIEWNDISLDAGLYLAVVSPDIGNSELVKFVIIK